MPLLKKPYLEAGDLKNYSPVSNLAFMSKVTERIVVERSSSAISRSRTRCQHTSDIIRQRPRFCVSCPTSTPLPTVKTPRCSVFWTCTPLSTASITTSSFVDCSSPSASAARHYRVAAVVPARSHPASLLQRAAVGSRRAALRRSTGLCPQPVAVSVVHRRVVRHHLECQTRRTFVRRRHTGQCSSRIRVGFDATFYRLRRMHQCLDT